MNEPRLRKNPRLHGFPYGSQATYFVTVVTAGRVNWFGEVVHGDLQLNGLGQSVEAELRRTAEVRPSLRLDAFVVMPNHVHAVLHIITAAPPVRHDLSGRATVSRTLGAAVRGFKAAATRRVNEIRQTPGEPLWQRNYYDHIVRNAAELRAIRIYIRNNPAHWLHDPENPDTVPDAHEVAQWGPGT